MQTRMDVVHPHTWVEEIRFDCPPVPAHAVGDPGVGPFPTRLCDTCQGRGVTSNPFPTMGTGGGSPTCSQCGGHGYICAVPVHALELVYWAVDEGGPYYAHVLWAEGYPAQLLYSDEEYRRLRYDAAF